MSLCQDCVIVVRHEGTPEGQIEHIGGVRCYVGTPTGAYARDKVLLFLPDIFGIDLVNAQLLADDFARCGLKTVVIDYFLGDAVPQDAFETGFDLAKWIPSHDPKHTRPEIDKVVAVLKEQGVTHFAATGYCFGARYAFDLAFEEAIKVTVVSHPSFLQIPEDLQKYKSQARAPLLINSCQFDERFPAEDQAEADKILGGGQQFTDTYRREYFAGCSHGFAVRGDLTKPEVKAGKEGAFRATVEFLRKHF